MKESSSASKVSDSNKDLLHLERNASVLEKRLRQCTSAANSSEREPPMITSMPESSVLGRIKSFLPALDQANQQLFSAIQERGTEEFNIESVSAGAERYVEMDLALGVAELTTPEALAAAELAANGQVLKVEDSEASSDDSSDSDIENKSDIAELMDVKRRSRSKDSRHMSDFDNDNRRNGKSPVKRKKIELL